MGEKRVCTNMVLIVEDDADLKDALAEMLEDNGYVTVRAADGRDGLQKLKNASERPCIILLDLMMPIMNGWQFRQAQLQDPELAKIPVVVLTAYRSAGGSQPPLQAPILTKPVDPTILLKAVEEYCEPEPRHVFFGL